NQALYIAPVRSQRQALIAIQSRSFNTRRNTCGAPAAVFRVAEKGTQCLNAPGNRDTTPSFLLQRLHKRIHVLESAPRQRAILCRKPLEEFAHVMGIESHAVDRQSTFI